MLLCELSLCVLNLKKFFVWLPYCYSKLTTNHTKIKVKGFWKRYCRASFQILNCDQRCSTLAALCSVVFLFIVGHWKIQACCGLSWHNIPTMCCENWPAGSEVYTGVIQHGHVVNLPPLFLFFSFLFFSSLLFSSLFSFFLSFFHSFFFSFFLSESYVHWKD